MTSTILNIPLLISASVFLVLFLFVVAIYQYIRQNARERALIAKVLETGENRIISNKENSSSETEDVVKNPILNFLRFLGKGSVSELSADYTKTRARFFRAGLRKANSPALFWGTKFLLAFSLFACFYLGIIFLKPVDTSTKLLASIFLALSGYFLPDIWLHIKNHYQKK